MKTSSAAAEYTAHHEPIDVWEREERKKRGKKTPHTCSERAETNLC